MAELIDDQHQIALVATYLSNDEVKEGDLVPTITFTLAKVVAPND